MNTYTRKTYTRKTMKYRRRNGGDGPTYSRGSLTGYKKGKNRSRFFPSLFSKTHATIGIREDDESIVDFKKTTRPDLHSTTRKKGIVGMVKRLLNNRSRKVLPESTKKNKSPSFDRI